MGQEPANVSCIMGSEKYVSSGGTERRVDARRLGMVGPEGEPDRKSWRATKWRVSGQSSCDLKSGCSSDTPVSDDLRTSLRMQMQ